MKFEDEHGQEIDISFENFGSVLPETRPGFTHVRLKNGKEVWVNATNDDVVEASAEE